MSAFFSRVSPVTCRKLLNKRTKLSVQCVRTKLMEPKKVYFGSKVRREMLEGIDMLADAVQITMGPKGRNVIIEEKNRPKITKDGYTVAQSVQPSGKLQLIGANIMHEITKKTNEEAGDGTSTATVLARDIIKEGMRLMEEGRNANDVKIGIKMAVDASIAKLRSLSSKVTNASDLERVALISANGDKKVASTIAKAYDKVGLEGVITIKSSNTKEDFLTVEKGYCFDSGYTSPYFVNAGKGTRRVEFCEPLIALVAEKINSFDEIIPLIQLSIQLKRALLIIAPDFSGDVMSALIVNRVTIGLNVCTVKAPGMADMQQGMMKDMAAVTGGVLIDEEAGFDLRKVTPSQLGSAKEVIVKKDETLFINGRGKPEDIEDRASRLRHLIEITRGLDRKNNYRERLGRLVAGIAIIHAGGISEVEVNEKKDRMVDAMNSVRCALEDGILPGGGVALLRCIPELEDLEVANDDQAAGVKIIKHALRAPATAILNNAGLDSSVIIHKLLDESDDEGYNVMTSKVVNMVDEGIVDPTQVVIRALRDASGVATLLTATEAAVTFIDEPKLKQFMQMENNQ